MPTISIAGPDRSRTTSARPRIPETLTFSTPVATDHTSFSRTDLHIPARAVRTDHSFYPQVVKTSSYYAPCTSLREGRP
ncbi:hypothetical protein BFJ68_g166 [Fusarium oxysporum]|uniref:Uncharacterized protein n=1 Tax=Fusarium oxysporum TaxID=5507 RepID=A0A420S8L2_FUSOX|nr:hypothetical protein BFJ71_g4974 [Fusarium oxysporum]RKL25529.1 hypothetical protein BFJ68_g166 [Fusarium oxysporum]